MEILTKEGKFRGREGDERKRKEIEREGELGEGENNERRRRKVRGERRWAEIRREVREDLHR